MSARALYATEALSLDPALCESSVMSQMWVLPSVSDIKIHQIQHYFQLSEIAAHLLAQRFSSIEEISAFLDSSLKETLPDPQMLPDHQKAYERLYQAILNQESIVVWGDYDVDGTCSAALCLDYFQQLGYPIQGYIPHRFQEGYGLNQESLARLVAEGMTLLITVDCGTTAHVPLTWLQEQGIDVIIIDHHLPSVGSPPCLAFVNPRGLHAPDHPYLEELCAAGLVFLFLVGWHRFLQHQGWFETRAAPDLKNALDLVALATVCDVMPLRHVNRAFVKQGLRTMQRRQRPGLRALMDVSGIQEPPNSGHLGFTIGPRLNAGGRIAQATLGLELLTTHSIQRGQELAQILNQLNHQRQLIEASIEEEALLQAEEQKQAPFLFIQGQDWHLGVMGIIAGRLKDLHDKPSFVISFSDGIGHGSARSVQGINVGVVIQQAHEVGILLRGGGHGIAAGFTVKPENVSRFLSFLEQKLVFPKKPLAKTVFIDSVCTFRGLKDHQFLTILDQMEPFGSGNPRPCLTFFGLRFIKKRDIRQHKQLFFAEPDGTMQMMMLFRAQNHPIVSFLEAHPTGLFDVIARLSLDRRGWHLKMQLHIDDLKLHR